MTEVDILTASILPKIAFEPGKHSQSSIAELFQLSRATAMRAVAALRKLEWIEIAGYSPRDSRGRRPELLKVNDKFWNDVTVCDERLRQALPYNDLQLYQEAIIQKGNTQRCHEGTLERDYAEAAYLGRITLLGQRHDPSDYSTWLSGALAWDSLITIEVAQTLPSTEIA